MGTVDGGLMGTFPSLHGTVSSHGCEDLLSQLEKGHIWHFEAISHLNDLSSYKGRGGQKNKNKKKSGNKWFPIERRVMPCCVVYLYSRADGIPLLNALGKGL